MGDINKEAMGFDLKISDMMKKSNRLAWSIAIISMLFAAAAISLYLYKPLTNTVPYVIKVNSDGVPNLLTSITEKNIEVEDAVDRYFIKEYVVRREEYYWNLLEKDYLFIQLLSSKDVNKQYQSIYSGSKGRDSIYKDKVEVSIKIKSIILGFGGGIRNATVRINKITLDKLNLTTKTEKLIITLTYKYNSRLRLNEKNRLENPLGFTVHTYKIDKEIG